MSYLSIKNSFFFLCLFLFACAHKPLSEKPVRLEKQKPAVLVQVLDSLSHLRPTSFYSKIKCHYSDTTSNLSFKASIRLIKDSVVNPNITFANIPILSAVIRPDSLLIANKKDKCFIRTDLNYIKESFGVDFDYRNFEEILFGLPVAYDSTQKYFPVNTPFHYILSSHRKAEFKKEIMKEKMMEKKADKPHTKKEDDEQNDETEDLMLIHYYIDSLLQNIEKVVIQSPLDSAIISVDYLSRDTVGGYSLPKEVLFDIVTPRNHIVLSMKYEKIEVDSPQEIYFIIPESYEACGSKK